MEQEEENPKTWYEIDGEKIGHVEVRLRKRWFGRETLEVQIFMKGSWTSLLVADSSPVKAQKNAVIRIWNFLYEHTISNTKEASRA
jgi:hypothetical protein